MLNTNVTINASIKYIFVQSSMFSVVLFLATTIGKTSSNYGIKIYKILVNMTSPNV